MEKTVNGLDETRQVIRHPLDNCSPSPELDISDINLDDSDVEDDKSIFHAIISQESQDCRLQPKESTKRLIKVRKEFLSQSISSSESSFHAVLSPERQDDAKRLDDVISMLSSDLDSIHEGFDSPDELEDSILEQLNASCEPISEYTAEEEREDVRSWKSVDLFGVERRIDMKVIEPYKRVLSHGGYMDSGSRDAIIVLSACFLPDKSRVDYNYVMENLSSYILSTLDELVTDDYLLVYLHGGAPKDCIPTVAWLRRHYQIVDRRLKKNIKKLYIVHPTFWLKAFFYMARPFFSKKFYTKITCFNSLAELYECLPLEPASIPERVCQYDRIKQSIQTTNVV